MSIPAEVRGKFYALRSLALAVGLSGIAAIVLGNRSFGLLSLGVVGVVAGLWLVRRSNAYVWRARGQVGDQWVPPKAAKRVGPWAWALTGACLVACGIAYYLMHLDALHGYKEVWPLNVFLGTVLALVVTSGYVAMRIFQ